MHIAKVFGLSVDAEPTYARLFVPGLLDPALAVPENVAGPRGKAARRRYDVYRNNVTVSLINALGEAFPATRRITGEDFFRAMARFYVRAHPPRSPLLFEYGRDFPTFIARYEYARPLPWLADVARMELAWLDAYHAADIAPLSQQALAAIEPYRLGDIVLTPHPATRIVSSDFPAVSIFVMNRGEGPVGRLETNQAEAALVTRPALSVSVRHLPPGGGAFIAELMAGRPLGSAAGAAMAQNSDFDLVANLAGILDVGAFTEAKLGDADIDGEDR